MIIICIAELINLFNNSEDRKSSMNSNLRNRRPEFANVWSEVRSIKFQLEGQQRLEMIHDTSLLRTNLGGYTVAAPVISTCSRLDDLFLLRVDNSVNQSVRKSMNFLSLVLKRYNKNFKSAGQPTPDISYSYMTESLQTSDELYSNSFNYSTHPPFEGTQRINPVLHYALQALILQILMVLKIAGKYRHVVILLVFLTQAACEDVQVPINCTSGVVITSPNYPATYPQYYNKNWFFDAPEGRMILLTFNNFSIGSSDEVNVIDIVDDGYRKQYDGVEHTIPPFLSRRNSLVLRFASDGNPTGNGFNISASCYELSDAYRSQDCSASYEKCTSTRAVKVKCFEPAFKGCYDLGNTQLQNGSLYDSTSQCITSCRANTSQAITIINGNECFCSTTDDIGLPPTSYVEDQSCALHQLVYNASVGFCNRTDDVINGSWDFDITWFGSIVQLTCDEGYRLKGNGTLQCVTAISTHIHVWNSSIPTCEMKADTSPSVTDGRNNADITISLPMTALLFFIICVVV